MTVVQNKRLDPDFYTPQVRPINDLPVHCDNTATRNLVVWEGITVLEDHSYILTVRVREHGNVKYINTMPDTTITEVDNIDTINTDDTTSSTIPSPGSYTGKVCGISILSCFIKCINCRRKIQEFNETIVTCPACHMSMLTKNCPSNITAKLSIKQEEDAPNITVTCFKDTLTSLTDTSDPAVLASLTTSMHVSHLCNKKLCVNLTHLSYEESVVNQLRKNCFSEGRCTGNHPGYTNFTKSIVQHGHLRDGGRSEPKGKSLKVTQTIFQPLNGLDSEKETLTLLRRLHTGLIDKDQFDAEAKAKKATTKMLQVP
ncbi:hypothetical protein Bbelb_051580 [Branchiostoma belcheri]|nr:hypothetical protein Bbelb_051580 [Branchiostoma belcheri]